VASVRTSSSVARYSSLIRAACANERSCGSVRGAISNGRPYRDLNDLRQAAHIVVLGGLPPGLIRPKSILFAIKLHPTALNEAAKCSLLTRSMASKLCVLPRLDEPVFFETCSSASLCGSRALRREAAAGPSGGSPPASAIFKSILFSRDRGLPEPLRTGSKPGPNRQGGLLTLRRFYMSHLACFGVDY
jgi:hypothetical protein